jgi:hypothetical protein
MIDIGLKICNSTGILSAIIMLLFTFILERWMSKFGQSYLSLVFIVPTISL